MKFKVGDIVNIKPDSDVAQLFDNGLNNLEIRNIENAYYGVWESDKSYYWAITEEDLELVESKYNFMWAVEQMKKGKKVTRKCVGNWFMIKEGNHLVRKNRNTKHVTKLCQFYDTFEIEATDWEIFEENKFGDFTSTRGTINFIMDGIERGFTGKLLDDLEKAIKRARELQ